MKIVDRTPFYDNETGKITLTNRAKAMVKFGGGWIANVEAQRPVMTVLDKVLDKGYTLLRNVTPPGLQASIPFILIGPTGVYVMCVTDVSGMFRAKGDQWGTVSGNNFKPEKPNLLILTERMARVIQVFLQRQGFGDLMTVEPVLLCANTGIHVDSLRPIVRVVMRDALERFAVSISQAHVVLSPETVHAISNRILNPPKAAAAQPAGAAAGAALLPDQGKSSAASAGGPPAFEVPGYTSEAGAPATWEADRLGFDFQSEAAPQAAGGAPQEGLLPQTPASPLAEAAAPAETPANPFPFPDTPPKVQGRKRPALTRGQIIFIVFLFLVWLIIAAIFGYFALTNLI